MNSSSIEHVTLVAYQSGSLLALAGIIFSISVISAIFVHLYRDLDFVKVSQPGMLLLILMGTTLGSFRILASAFPVSEFICRCNPFMMFNGVALTYGGCVVMLWRADRLLNNPFQKITILENYAIRIVVSITILVCSSLFILVFVGRPYVNRLFIDNNHFRTVCSWRRIEFFWALIVSICLSIVYGAYLAYKTRNIINHFNESGVYAIGMSKYI